MDNNLGTEAGFFNHQVSRREFLQMLGAAAAGGFLTTFLGACSAEEPQSAQKTIPTPAPAPTESVQAESQRFMAEVNALIPNSTDPFINDVWHKGETMATLSVAPPKGYLELMNKERDPDKRLLMAIRYGGIQTKQKATDTKTGQTVERNVPSARWNWPDVAESLGLCNYYAAAIAEMLTYEGKLDKDGNPLLNISSIVNNKANAYGSPGKPLYFADAMKLHNFIPNANGMYMSIPAFDQWFRNYGSQYGWKRVADEQTLLKVLNERKVIVGLRKFHKPDADHVGHSWILTSYKSSALGGRLVPIVTQATRDVFMERIEDTPDRTGDFKYNPWKYPPQDNGIAENILWVYDK